MVPSRGFFYILIEAHQAPLLTLDRDLLVEVVRSGVEFWDWN